MMNQMIECEVDISIGKCTDEGVSMSNENSEEQLMKLLGTISKVTKGNENLNVESVFREIEKLAAAESKANRKSVHWFIDTETFVTLKSSLIDFHLPPNLVNLYVIGELETFFESFNLAKDVTRRLDECSVKICFLVCPADLDELTRDILSEKRYEMKEKSVRCFIGKKRFGATILLEHQYDKPGWSIKNLNFIGFLSEIEICRLGFSTYRNPSPESQVSIYVETEPGRSVLWSISNYMLSDNKNQRLALFKYYEDRTKEEKEMKKKRKYGYCLLLAYENESKDILSDLIRLPTKMNMILSKRLRYAEEINEPKQRLPDDTYQPIAPVEHRVIKRKLTDIGTLKSAELKRKRYEKLAGEYNYLGARDTFLEFTAMWRKQNGFEVKAEAESNN